MAVMQLQNIIQLGYKRNGMQLAADGYSSSTCTYERRQIISRNTFPRKC